jgi:hypothetical protein
VTAQCERMSFCPDNQEVGLEAAILERVRNSSLVEWSGADNVPGLKPSAEAADARLPQGSVRGRGAFPSAEKPSGNRRWSDGKSECRHE